MLASLAPFTPRPPATKQSAQSGNAGNNSSSSSTLPVLIPHAANSPAALNSTLIGIGAVSGTYTKPPPRLPGTQRKINAHAHATTGEVSPVASPSIPARAPLSFPPANGSNNNTNGGITNITINTANITNTIANTTPWAVHSPSPLGSAYDEVRIPMAAMDPPLMVGSPASSTSILHPQPTSPATAITTATHEIGISAAHTLAPLPLALQSVPLPASFHHTNSVTPTNSRPNHILIPPTPNMPLPVLWNHAPETNSGVYSPPSPSIPSGAGQVQIETTPVIAPLPSPGIGIGIGTPNPTSSASPFNPPAASPFNSSTSMDSRQWAQLLFKYRAGDTPSASSRATGAPNGHQPHQHQPTNSHVAAFGFAPAPATTPSSSNGTPLYSPNSLTSTSLVAARPPSGRSRVGAIPPSTEHIRRPSLHDDIDPEKQAMQNELDRLRAMVAMQAHAAASPMPAMVAPAAPSPAAPAITLPPQHQQPNAHAALSNTSTPGGAGLSWNTAFAALSNTFLQSSSPYPTVTPAPAAPTVAPAAAVASEPPFTSLPSPAVAAESVPDHRNTFRSMSMLIRAGSAAHASSQSNLATANAITHFPHPPAAGLLIRSRSAEEPTSHQQAGRFTSVDVSDLDEIEEDLSHCDLSSPTLTSVAPPRQFVQEIEEESHLNDPITNPTAGVTSDDADANGESGDETSSRSIMRHNSNSASTGNVGGVGGVLTHSNLSSASSSTNTSSNSIPLFLPSSIPPSSRKSTRPTCTDAACNDRARRERLDLQKAWSEELSSIKSKLLATSKVTENRLRRELATKDARIAQLEKTQLKLLQPTSKILARNDELEVLIQKLREQVIQLGGTPVGGGGAGSTVTHATELKQDESIATNNSGDTSDGPPDTPLLQEPFFSQSAPRTVNSKTRRRSQSFNGGSKMLKHSTTATATPTTTMGVDLSSSAANSPRNLQPQAAPTNVPPTRPSNLPHAARPRKNSLKITTTVAHSIINSGAAGGTEVIPSSPIVAIPAPVTTRPHRQQTRGRANSGTTNKPPLTTNTATPTETHREI